jgi:hypothetical protein
MAAGPGRSLARIEWLDLIRLDELAAQVEPGMFAGIRMVVGRFPPPADLDPQVLTISPERSGQPSRKGWTASWS